MKKRHAFIAAAAAALLFVSLAPTTAHADPSPEEVEEQIKEKGKELEAAIEDYNGAKEDLKDTKKRIKEIEKALPELEAAAAASREVATEIAVSSYTGGKNISAVSTLLDGSPDQAMERMSVLGSINASQASDLAAFTATSKNLEDEKGLLEDLKADQKKIADDMKKEADRLDEEMEELEDLKAQVDPPSGYDGQLPPPPSGDAGAAVQYAHDQLGKPYQWGAAGPGSFDCSGLTMMAWSQAGVGLSHQASAQWNETPRVSRSDLAAGDLVFYNDLNHVGIYIGDGKIIHAPTTGKNVSVVGIDSMPIVGYGRPN